MDKQYNQLTPHEENIIQEKGTEAPYSGKYNSFYEDGMYTCRRCNASLYASKDKFDSGCGWPSFDDEIEGAIKRTTDADGRRVEITCRVCDGHLGHVFESEGLTDKNIRHCVNSASLGFTPALTKKAYYAGGCFWGVEYYFNKQKGVLDAISGFMGGHLKNPTYQDICYKDTGHLEVVEVSYNPKDINYKDLTKLFFEIHDPSQTDGQGPDIGSQYLSAVFILNEKEREVVIDLIDILEKSGLHVATEILEKQEFYLAEEYHQYYYRKNGKTPYCHSYVKRFK
jgi:peptide methionine sulfoxide reductase msrA/msrB